jgi:hypothetical protein
MNHSLLHIKIIIIIIILFIFVSLVDAGPNQNKIIDENLVSILNISGNQPPETPEISGPTIGKPGTELEYSICSVDPENNDVIYCFDWGDDTGQICIGPYPSGEEVKISHTWIENGTYTITVKASDIFGEESGLATLRVKISTSRIYPQSRNIIINILHLLKNINKWNSQFLASIFIKN